MADIFFWFCVITILYVYIGYPLILYLVAFLHSQPTYDAYYTPTVTLLIPAFNEQHVIENKIRNSLELDYPSNLLQIIVAADGSTDNTVKIVGEYAAYGVELSFDLSRAGKMSAINRAMSQVRGDIIVLSDANNMFCRDTLRHLVAPFSDTSVGGVSGAKRILRGDGALGDSEGLYWKYESYIKKLETRLGCCVGVVGEIFAIRGSLKEKWPNEIINDDFYIAIRIIKKGYKIFYNEKAVSIERVSETAEDEITRRARIIAGRFQAMKMVGTYFSISRPIVVWQVISHKFMRPIVPLAMVGAFCTNIVLVIHPQELATSSVFLLSYPSNWILLGIQVVFYGAALLGGYLYHTKYCNKVLYLPTFFVNSNIAALLGLYRFVVGSQTPIWQRVKRRGEDEKLDGNIKPKS